MQITQYPRNADGSPMDLQTAVLVDNTGNGGARLLDCPTGPDKAPIDTIGLVLIDMAGNRVDIQAFAVTKYSRAELASFNYASVAMFDGSFWDLVDYAPISVKVDGDATQQGIFVRNTSNTSKVWARRIGWAVNPVWWGVVEGAGLSGAARAANDAAISAMFVALNASAINTNTTQLALYPIEYPGGWYEFGAVHDLNFGIVRVGGANAGHPGFPVAGTTVKFFGTTGFRVQSPNSSGATTKDVVDHTSAAYSSFENLHIMGNFPEAGVEADYHGIHARAPFRYRNIIITDFAGEGIRHDATASADGGNANNSSINSGSVLRCRDGLYCDGGDVNASIASGLVCSSNRRWGFNISPLINYTLIGCNSSSNGYPVLGTPPSMTFHLGHVYFVIVGQEGWCSANAPSGTATSNQGWAYLGDTGVADPTRFPQWVAATTYRAGGCYTVDQPSAFVEIIGCYAESNLNQGKAQLVAKTIVRGGNLVNFMFDDPAKTPAPSIAPDSTGLINTNAGYKASCGTTTVQIGSSAGLNANMILTKMAEPTISPNGHGFRFDTTSGNNVLFTYGNSNNVANYSILVTGPVGTETFGRAAAVIHAVYIPRFFIGGGRATGRQLLIDAAAQVAAASAQGDWTLARDNSANRIGWKTTIAGTTVQEMFGLSQLAAAGSGLTMAATDKILGRSSAGAGAVQEITCTAAGRAIIDDADAAAQRTTLGLGAAALAAKAGTSGATYAAPAGGTTVDAEARTALGQLAADVADMKAKLQAAGLMV